MIAGCAIVLGGIVLWVGEKAGRLLIFPFAGRLTMLLGAGCLAIGTALAGRRAALTLSVLMIIGGMALYMIGLAFLEQLGSRLYQAFGLLTTLVGLVAAYAIYGMESATQPSAPGKSEKGPHA
jgi:hypothetical protein